MSHNHAVVHDSFRRQRAAGNCVASIVDCIRKMRAEGNCWLIPPRSRRVRRSDGGWGSSARRLAEVAELRFGQQLRQLGDIGRDPPRLGPRIICRDSD